MSLSLEFLDSSLSWDVIAEHEAFQEIVSSMQEEASRLLKRPIPELTEELYALFETTGNRLQYEQAYFERRRRLTTFALLSLIYPQQPLYEQSLLTAIEAILTEKTWCLPAHMRGNDIATHIDLFAAETGFTLAEIITLLKERIPASLTEQMLENIERRLFYPYLNHGPYHWEDAHHNWAAVCTGSIASAALLLEKDKAFQAKVIKKALSSMDCYLFGFGEDGACLEGLGYWNYGFGYFIYFSDLLKRATNGQINLLDRHKVKEIALFQQRFYLIEDRPPNFSDAEPYIRPQLGLSDYLAAYYDEIEYIPTFISTKFTDDHCSRFQPAVRNILWHMPNAPRAEQWKQGSYYFDDAQLLISKYASNGHKFGFAAKGGSNDEPHNHIDVGHFILLADHEPAFAADLGSGEYTSDYFGEGRYRYDCTGAVGHSIPVIGGVSQRLGQQAKAKLLHIACDEAEDQFHIDLTECYEQPALEQYRRAFQWIKQELPALRLTDQFEFKLDEAIRMEEVFVSSCKPQWLKDGLILLQGEHVAVLLSYEPARYEYDSQQRYYMNHHGQEEIYYRLSFVSYDSRQHTFEFQFVTNDEMERLR